MSNTTSTPTSARARRPAAAGGIPGNPRGAASGMVEGAASERRIVRDAHEHDALEGRRIARACACDEEREVFPRVVGLARG